ncbi:unannotated protein [freshwater metagenome]|uniref:Unannotated protein n=1 Tax=freshwater metagenome TaxID=449393 RepID=A0A6J7JIB9_9ZZZZ
MTAQPHDPSTVAPASVKQAVALADAALGAAGHEVTVSAHAGKVHCACLSAVLSGRGITKETSAAFWPGGS